MATYPLFPTIPTEGAEFEDDETDDTSDTGSDLVPKFDLGGSSDDEDDDFDDDDGLGDISTTAAFPGDLTKLMTLGKPAGAFPTGAFPMTQRVQAAPVTLTTPVPLPAPIIGGLRLNLLPQAAPAITGLTLPMAKLTTLPTAQVPTLTTLPTAQVPTIPAIGGLVIPQQQPPAPATKKIDVDVEAIFAKMPGITITGTPGAPDIAPDVNDLLIKDSSESDDEFEARRTLTLKLASIPDYKLNGSTCLTIGHMMMKKSKMGLTYDPDIENAIGYLMALLQR